MLFLAKSPTSKELCSSLWNLMVQQLRYSNRPNLKRPLPPHFNRARMLAVCEPVYPKPPRNCEKDALIVKNTENILQDNLYAIFLARKLRKDLQDHPVTCIFHYNSFTQHELINIRGSLYDMNFDMKIQPEINRNMVRLALTGTRWAPLIPLAESRTALGFCKGDDINKLLKALKKMPQFLLIAMVAYDRILSKNAVEELARLRDITNVRAQLCSTLALQSVTLSQNLTANINALSHSLTTYSQPGEDTRSSSSSSDSDSDSDSSSSSHSDGEKGK
ncbi:unnamed protein product [Orchesella dallaii]|uniref:Large ribosomal subunit protein uL10m n=1 Tax=Orchesella dallaii TaxID=48710 RepID=A0ABP1PUP8_9HEXA